MQSPSQYILEGLLAILREKQLTTSALAKQVGKSKREVKSILSGQTPLTVDDLSTITQALDIKDADLQRFMNVPITQDLDDEEHESDALVMEMTKTDEVEPEENWVPNPVGVHSMQALKVGFALGCNLFFIANTRDLQDSGIPEAVLKQYGDKLPIRLDSEYFHHYRPEYFDDGLEIRLSFDAVYTCFFPWHVFEQVTFFVDDDEVEANDPVIKGPTLRIID